ncbi:MAG TPA: hypothetical protein VKE22_25655 [Haliangiales bacterium]|nr:hypothetical protein [Haliangiales bacterium]
MRFDTEILPEEIDVRLCQCSFCRRHASRTATDPRGNVAIEVADAGALSRYVFGLRTSEFLLCARCGVYVAVIMVADGAAYATLNVNALDDRVRFGPGRPVDFEGEDAAGRVARRKAKWTPATLVVGGG